MGLSYRHPHHCDGSGSVCNGGGDVCDGCSGACNGGSDVFDDCNNICGGCGNVCGDGGDVCGGGSGIPNGNSGTCSQDIDGIDVWPVAPHGILPGVGPCWYVGMYWAGVGVGD